MRTTRNGPRKRRRGTPRTVIFCIVLMAVASGGCGEERKAQDGVPEQNNPLAAPASPSAEESSRKQPKIRFDQPDHDFGDVEAGKEVEHTFAFENAGEGPLSVERVLSSCGCAGALVSEEEVPPGGKGKIKVTLDTKGFQGTVKKGLTVESNDPENRLVRLTIGGNVVSEVEVEPRYLDWATVLPGDSPRPKRLSIRFLDGRGLRLERIQSESPSVILTKESEGQREMVYSVALAENLPSGRFTGRITIRSNSERVPEVHVPFHGEIQGNVKVSPHILTLGRMTPGKALTRHLSVSKTGSQGFTVRQVKATTEAIAAEIREEKAEERYRIQVTYTPGNEARGRVAERITILVNDGQETFLEVPLYGTVGEEVAKTEDKIGG